MAKWLRQAILLFAFASTAAAQDRAHFKVTSDVLLEDMRPFTATIGAIGNGADLVLENPGFEPVIFRNRLKVTEDHPNRVYADQDEISNYDTLRSSALDGAEVHVYRIENGTFRRVRQDRVRAGGHVAEGWFTAFGGRLLPPETTSVVVSWPRFTRRGVPVSYALGAVAEDGQVSERTDQITVVIPDEPGPRRDVPGLARFRPDRDARSRRPSMPEGFEAAMTPSGHLRLSWTSTPGNIAGYQLFRTFTDPEQHRGFFLELEGDGPPLRQGDMVIVSKKLYSASRGSFASNRVWDARDARDLTGRRIFGEFADEIPGGGWRFAPHASDTPVDAPGETYLSVELPDGGSFSVRHVNHSGTGQDRYAVLDPAKTHVLDIWARGESGARAEFVVRDALHGPAGDRTGSIPIPLGRDWARHQIPFRMADLFRDAKPRGMRLELSGPGRIDVDNFRIYEAGTPYLRLHADDQDRLRQSGMSALRTHRFVKTGLTTYDLDQLTNPGGAASGLRGGVTLPAILGSLEPTDQDLWLQVEPHFSPEEWMGLVEFLAAPYDPASDTPATKPWAAKRAAQGRLAPWTDAFDKIYFELGNETWNRIMRPWVFRSMPDAATGEDHSNGAVYGMYNEYVAQIMASSPHWPDMAPKVEFVVGGWAWSPRFGELAAEHMPSADHVMVAGYNGGWDDGEDAPDASPQSYFRILNQPTQLGENIATLAEIAEDVSDLHRRPVFPGIYEAGPGYALDGLNRASITPEQAATQEIVMKSVAAATATLDAFMARAAAGYKVQNFFTFGPGVRWKSHAHWYRGGQDYPSWDLLSLVNREGLGDVLRVETRRAPRADIPPLRKAPAVRNAATVGVHATRAGDRLTVMMVSRRVPGHPEPADLGDTLVTLDLPIADATGVTQYQFDAPYFAHNVDRVGAKLVASSLDLPSDFSRYEAPLLGPGQTMILVFDGVSE